VLSGDPDQTQLLQGRDAVIEPDFLTNLAVLQLEKYSAWKSGNLVVFSKAVLTFSVFLAH
jgi:hypothetical protein